VRRNDISAATMIPDNKMIFDHKSYRTYLKSVLADRITKNQHYSLRAMAKQLGIQSSHLSAVCSGKKNLSLQAAVKITQKLGLNEKETQYFCSLIQFETAKSPELKNTFFEQLQIKNSFHKVQDLNIDAFKFISDWYHIPILEMTELADFKFNPLQIAKRLRITKVQAEAALERLERLELLEKDSKGLYRKVHNNALFKSEKPNTALRSFHRHMLEKAIESLETQSPQERHIGSQTFSIDPNQIEGAKKMITDFNQKLVAYFDTDKKKTQTYHFSFQLFNLTGGNQ